MSDTPNLVLLSQTFDINFEDYAHLEPTGNKVFIVRDKAPATTLYVPEEERQQMAREMGMGTIVAVGLGKLDHKGDRIPVKASVGTRVALSPNMHADVKVDGLTVVVTEVNLCIAIVHPRGRTLMDVFGAELDAEEAN